MVYFRHSISTFATTCQLTLNRIVVDSKVRVRVSKATKSLRISRMSVEGSLK